MKHTTKKFPNGDVFDPATTKLETRDSEPMNDADNGIIHMGGESKEEIEAEDRWHEEQMNPTKKILEAFDEKFPNLGATDPKEGWYDAKPEVKSFLSTSIAQAIAEERERVVDKDDLLDDMWGLICNVNGGIVEKEKPEWYTAFLRIRAKYFVSLDKLTDKESNPTSV